MLWYGIHLSPLSNLCLLRHTDVRDSIVTNIETIGLTIISSQCMFGHDLTAVNVVNFANELRPCRKLKSVE